MADADAEEPPECPICLIVLTPDDCFSLSCRHQFHHGCLLEYLRSTPTNYGCCVCRRHVLECVPLSPEDIQLKQACLWMLTLSMVDETYTRAKSAMPPSSHTHFAAAMIAYFKVCIGHNPHPACRAYMTQLLGRTRFSLDAQS